MWMKSRAPDPVPGSDDLHRPAREGVTVETQRPIRVLVVDDVDEIRKLLHQILDLEPDLEVVGEARDGILSLERVGELLPDAVVMDMEMPRMGGVEATREIKRRWPWVEVIAFTASGKRIDHHAMLQAGAYVKLDKQEAKDLPDAIRKAVQVRWTLMGRSEP